MSGLGIAIFLSELLACYLVWRLWHSEELLLFKACYSVVVFIPFLGPFFVIWSANIPSVQPLEFQDRSKYTSDVFDRWRRVIDEKNPHSKFRMWQRITKGDKNDENSP